MRFIFAEFAAVHESLVVGMLRPIAISTATAAFGGGADLARCRRSACP